MKLISLLFFLCISCHPFTIMLEPAGDAKHAGRTIDDSFERGITLRFAESLKKEITKAMPRTRVILSRFPGESLERLQNANFANRLQVDLYISLHVYQEIEAKPKVYLYYFVQNKTTDFWACEQRKNCMQDNGTTLELIPYDKAHLQNLDVTKLWAEMMLNAFKRKQYRSLFEVRGLYAVPFKPLVGVTMPALGIEVSLKSKDDWNVYIQPIIDGIGSIVSKKS